MTDDYFRNEFDEVTRKRKDEQAYGEWLELFKRVEWNPERIVKVIEADEYTLCALVDATKRGDLKLGTELGRNVWNAVRRHYHGLNREDMLNVVNRGIYDSTVPDWRREGLYAYAAIMSAAAFTITIGFADHKGVSDSLESRAHRKYVEAKLGPIEKSSK